jgi:hypothetical protein
VRLVILESPFAGNLAYRQRYLRAAMLDCLGRGEAPFASHGLYTQCLDDTVPEQRKLGIDAGFAWRHVASLTVAYRDLGISGGMRLGIDHANRIGQAVEYRKLGGEWADHLDRLEAARKREVT